MINLNEFKENINRIVLYLIKETKTVLEPFIEPLLEDCSENVAPEHSELF